MSTASTSTISFTRAYREDGAPVGKAFRIADGRIQQDKTAKRHPDRFEVVAVEPGAALAQWVRDLYPSDLVVAGVPKNGERKGHIAAKAHRTSRQIALSDEDFEWPDGPGVLLLDYDPKSTEEGWEPRLTLGMRQFRDVLEKVVPGITGAFAAWPSSGSCIVGDGVEPRGMRGFHHALPVRDATDIPRAGRVLHKLLVLAGYGFPFVTKAGVVLVRSIVDTAIWRPAQPLFLGGASCGPGLIQDRAPHFQFPQTLGPLLDTRSLIPDLAEHEEEGYEAMCRQLTEAAAGLARARRDEHEARLIERRAARIATVAGCSIEEARERAAKGRATEAASSRLSPDGRREVRLSRDAQIETERGTVTVGEILASLDEWDGALCADPEEPDYGVGVGIARINTNGTPNINSFAHGGCLYWLGRPTAAEEFDDCDDAGEGGCVGPAVEQPADPADSRSEQGHGGSIGAEAIAGDAQTQHGPGEARGASASTPAPKPAGSRRPAGVSGVVDAATLLEREFSPVEWTVEGVLPRGCWVLAGKPKTGKSWFALELLLAVAAGRPFLGKRTECGEVLYLALEDNDRRMQGRLKQLGAARLAPEALGRFKYQTAWPGSDECFKQLKAYLRDNPAVRVVAVDTLAKVKKEAGRTGTAYDQDYSALGPFHAIATEFGISVLLVTHLRKTQSTDAFDDISGSAAILGAVDGAMVLAREVGKRLSLRVRGRDLEDDVELVLQRAASGQFEALGQAEVVARTDLQLEVLRHLEFVGSDGATATEVHKALGSAKFDSVSKCLTRLANSFEVTKQGKRYYREAFAPPPPPALAAGSARVRGGAGARTPESAPQQ